MIDSWLSIESVKRIDRWGDGLAQPLTGELELVPTHNPLALKVGEKLRVRVFYRASQPRMSPWPISAMHAVSPVAMVQ